MRAHAAAATTANARLLVMIREAVEGCFVMLTVSTGACKIIPSLISHQGVILLFMIFDMISMHAGHGFQLRDIQTTQKVKATQVIGT